jgi:hypothetical protein
MSSATEVASPLFVVGFYRSGTSLLHALLNQHPRIALMYECDVLKLWPLVREHSVKQDWLPRLQYWNRALSRHRIDAGKMAIAQNRKEAAMGLYRNFAAGKDATIVGEKSPYYYDCLPQLAADFPNSRIIVLWRSPGEILRSIEKASAGERFFAGRDWPHRLRVGLKSMAAGCAQLRAQGHQLLEVDYPALINQQEQTLRDICSFIGIEFDSRMMSLNGADTSMLPAGEHHRNVRGGRVLSMKIAGISSIDRQIAGAFQPSGPRPLSAPRDRDLSTKGRLIAAGLEARDCLIRTLYGYCPVPILQQWRTWRCRRFNERQEQDRSSQSTAVAVPVG